MVNSPKESCAREMRRVTVMTAITLMVSVMLMGCQSVRAAWAKRLRRDKAASGATDYAPRLGVIASVNAPLKFVLVDCGTAPVPGKGRELRVYRNGAIVAELTATSKVKRPYLLADIEAGTPIVGDAVMQLGTGWTGPLPQADLPVGVEKARAQAFAEDPVIASGPARAQVSRFRRSASEGAEEVAKPVLGGSMPTGSDWFLQGR